MCEFIKPKKLTFDNEVGLFSKPKIKPLLSLKIEQPKKLQIDIKQYEVSKPYVSPVQIKTEYQNAEKVKTDFVSDEKVVAKLGPDYNPLCTQLSYEADIRNSKERIFERKSKKSIQGDIIKASKSMDYQIMYFLILESSRARSRPQNMFHYLTWLFSDSEIARELGHDMVPNHGTQTTKTTGVCALK